MSSFEDDLALRNLMARYISEEPPQLMVAQAPNLPVCCRGCVIKLPYNNGSICRD